MKRERDVSYSAWAWAHAGGRAHEDRAADEVAFDSFRLRGEKGARPHIDPTHRIAWKRLGARSNGATLK